MEPSPEQLPKVVSEQEWCLKLLEEQQVLVQPGWFYDVELEPVIIVSLLTPVERARAEGFTSGR